MRAFPYITIGKVLEELNEEIYQVNLNSFSKEVAESLPKISRVAFYRKEKKLDLPTGRKSIGGWRVYTRDEAEEIKKRIKEDLNILNSAK